MRINVAQTIHWIAKYRIYNYVRRFDDADVERRYSDDPVQRDRSHRHGEAAEGGLHQVYAQNHQVLPGSYITVSLKKIKNKNPQHCLWFNPKDKHADLPFEKIVLLEPFYFPILFFIHSEETRHDHFRVAVNILCPVTQPLHGKVNNNKNSPTTCSLWKGD